MSSKNACPECGSSEIAGLMAAFWVPLDREGDMKGNFSDHESSTELTPVRVCQDCGHEWEIE